MPALYRGADRPGDRKSVAPTAERLAPGDCDQRHHFVPDGVWDEAPLELKLAIQADKLVGGADAFLVIDDTASPKKGTHSVGGTQYASALGDTANCHALVSLTLARGICPRRRARAAMKSARTTHKRGYRATKSASGTMSTALAIFSR